jgi:hypothetical protein
VRRLALLAAFCAAAAPAAAAVSVTSEINNPRIAMNEQLVLSVTVAGDQASLPSPKIPPMDAFNVYDSGTSQSLNFVNGRMSSSVVYTYVLTPRSAGKFQIPPITADGAAPSAPLNVEVAAAGSPAAAPPAAAPPSAAAAPQSPSAPGSARPARARTGRASDVYVTASLDRPRAYVNQQVTLTVRFLNAVQLLGNASYEPPQMTGFLTEELPPVRNGSTQIDGRTYNYTEIKIALFPIQPGRLTIGPAVVRCQIARMGGGGTGDTFFDRFFAMSAPEPVAVNSDPLTLQADPLPAGKPEDFTGVVGHLNAHASVDHADVKAGDAVNLTVTVSGTGNVKSIPEPKKPDLPSLRFFATDSSASVDKTNDRIGGSKTFRTVVVPRVSGSVSVPPFVFSYFDPERGAYARAETEELSLRVAPGAPGSASAANAPMPAATGLTAIADDIRYLKTAPANAPLPAALAAFADLGPWHALPFAFLLAAAFAAWRRRAAEADPRGRRRREALARAEARLKAAAALPPADAARAAALAGEALAGFVADKLDAPAAGLTLKNALDGLKSRPKPPSAATLERLAAAWEEADLLRFAPGGAAGGAARFADETAVLLKALDQELRR